jgi:hypothetical protein
MSYVEAKPIERRLCQGLLTLSTHGTVERHGKAHMVAMLASAWAISKWICCVRYMMFSCGGCHSIERCHRYSRIHLGGSHCRTDWPALHPARLAIHLYVSVCASISDMPSAATRSAAQRWVSMQVWVGLGT